MEIVLLVAFAVILGLAIIPFNSPSAPQEVYIIRTQPQPVGCGPVSFFFLGVFVYLVVVLLFVTG